MERLVSDSALSLWLCLLACLFLARSFSMASVLSTGKGKTIFPGPRALIVNADEVTIRQIPVNFVEWEEGEAQQVGKRVIVPRVSFQRTALISDYVPAALYDSFMGMYDDILSIMQASRSISEAQEVEGQPTQADLLSRLNAEQLQKFQSMQYQLVLAVWKLSEPDMDEQRLREGLEEEQVLGLFNHFFSRLSRQKKGKAKNAAPTSSANAPESDAP